MSAKMQVLFAKQTGHVLAAFTRTADPEGKPKVSDLTGNGLLVRQYRDVIAAQPNAEMIVPAEALDLAVVDLDLAVFSSPREYVEGGGEIAKLGPNTIILALNSAALPMPPPPPPGFANPPEVRFSTTRATVQLDADTADDKGVCIVMEEVAPMPGVAPERRVAQGKIAAGTHFISLDWKTSPDGSAVSAPSRSFYMLVMLAGYQPLFGIRTPL